jgi:hypothetical protein
VSIDLTLWAPLLLLCLAGPIAALYLAIRLNGRR